MNTTHNLIFTVKIIIVLVVMWIDINNWITAIADKLKSHLLEHRGAKQYSALFLIKCGKRGIIDEYGY